MNDNNNNEKDKNEKPELIVNNIKRGTLVRCGNCKEARLYAPRKFSSSTEPPDIKILCGPYTYATRLKFPKAIGWRPVTKEFYAKCVLTKEYEKHVR